MRCAAKYPVRKDPFAQCTAAERALFSRLSTPKKIQDYLDRSLAYNAEQDGETCRSPRHVIKTRRAHCIEGALLACAALRYHGHKPLIVDLEGKQDFDHVICVFKQNGYWGAISKSAYHTLGWRDPVFKTLRELALSYFVFYNNKRGSKTLHTVSVPVDVSRFDKINWITTDDNLWDIGNYLFTVKHSKLIPDEHRKHLRPLSKHFMRADSIRPA
jgi:hypothetical protein